MVGINRSFLVNTYYPLYSTFFEELGFEPVIPNSVSQEGIDKREAPFCYPGELTHGFFHTLLHMEKPPEYIFLPHFKSVPSQNGQTSSQVCPFVQGETFYLQTTFREKLEELKQKGTKLLTPLFNLTKGLETARTPLTETAIMMGADSKKADAAFTKALNRQTECMTRMKEIGKRALKELEADPGKTAAVVFARPYNGFVEEAHMGIPHKLASRGVPVIPFDFLPFENEKTKRHMYWGMGQLMLKAARFVKKHPQLFGIYITNFSCGPDSFLIGYFREIMGRKPSLTLELDSHTADAGLETRIEAFLDIVAAYRQLEELKLETGNRKLEKHQVSKFKIQSSKFKPARTSLDNGVPNVITSFGETLPMTDPRVTFLIPSMGKTSSEALAAAFRSAGFNALAHPPSDEEVLKLGRANTSCKECLPLILSTGTLLSYLGNGRRKDEVVVYFMATASGPCRFGQYYIFLEDFVKKQELSDVALFSLSAENSYSGIGNGFHKKAWWAIIVSDVMEDIRSMILANATDIGSAVKIFNEEWELILGELENGDFSRLKKQLIRTARRFRQILMKRPPGEVPAISLVGEIFVRRDHLSRQNLTERLAEKGFATICAPIAEWLHYCDFLADNELVDQPISVMEKFKSMIRKIFMVRYERRIKSALSGSGLVHAEPLRIRSLIDKARPYISPNLTCEAILTVGSSLSEVVSHTCGVIAIGPFGCMPNRMSEAILSETMTRQAKLVTEPGNRKLQSVLSDVEDLPFLAIETDGSPFPQLIDAKLETFCLRAERLHSRMLTVS
ncbi:MAG: hypothetical protein GY749_04985 [Desulfobacteraceae bacterium]|nr:hypothetical protein [Desulfobacteraceae bacterium]